MYKARILTAEREIVVPDEQTLLSAALEAGIAYPHGCRAGRCGSCKTRLVSGTVDLLPHTPFSLTTDERAQGLILACRAQLRTDIMVKWLRQPLPDYPIRRVTGRIAQLDFLTHDIMELRVRLDEPFAHAPGQYGRLELVGLPGRDYSMAPSPEADLVVFNIRIVPGGKVSGAIAELARPGQAVSVTGPFGDAYLREDHTRPILMVAGGSGLAPILAIATRAVSSGMRQPMHVYMGMRSQRDIYGIEALEALRAIHPGLQAHAVLSAAMEDGPVRAGFVHEAIAADIADMAGWKAYVAGPPVMVEAVAGVCSTRRLREGDLHADIFFTPATVSAPETGPCKQEEEGENAS